MITMHRLKTKLNFRQIKHNLPRLAPLFILIIGIIAATVLTYQSQEFRRRAAPGDQAPITLDPGGTQFSPNSNQKITIRANTQNFQVDGIQVILDFSGNIPSDLKINTPESISGLNKVAAHVQDHEGNKRIFLAYITSNPQAPYSTNSNQVTLGEIEMTTPASGNLTISFNQTLTKILQNQSSDNIAHLPQTSHSYSFSGSGTPATTEPTNPPTQAPATNPPTQAPATNPPTQTPTPTDSSTKGGVTTSTAVSYTLKVKFAGVNSNIGTIHARIVGQDTDYNSYLNKGAPFVYAGNGYYQTSVKLPTSGSYKFAIKAEKHIQRVYSNVNVAPHTRILDLTSKIIRPGDLPSQDGKLDHQDLTRLFSIIPKAIPNNNDLWIGDVNYDQSVNSLDVGLLMSTIIDQ